LTLGLIGYGMVSSRHCDTIFLSDNNMEKLVWYQDGNNRNWFSM